MAIPREDLTGRQFGELTVLSFAGVRYQYAFWTCRCSCGSELSVSRKMLVSGRTAACKHHGAYKEPEPSVTGRFSEGEKAVIARLAEKGGSSSEIARVLKRKPSSVNQAMYSMGFGERRPVSRRSYARKNGTAVRVFTPEEDAFASSSRSHGMTFAAISRAWSERFGYPRTVSAIRTRLIMLAAREDEYDQDWREAAD